MRRSRLRGLLSNEGAQAIVLVALLGTVLFGFAGLVIDISFYELSLVRIQRAADAGALAGSVYLPGNVSGGQTAALAATTQNGFANGVNGVTVTAAPDGSNPQLMVVTVTASTRTFFMRLFGIQSLNIHRNARAEFILPVPMGSPLSYYGVSILCRNSDTPPTCPSIPSATGVGNDASQGFWGAVEQKGSERGNGDAYSTYYNGSPSLNTAFDAGGYNYIVDFPTGATGGKVWIFDPIFCATGAGTSTGRRLGTGDFWLGNGGTAVKTEFKLWDMNGTPYSTTDDILVAGDGGLFASMNYADKGTTYRGNQNYGGGYDGSSSSDCQSNIYHNAWWLMATNLAAGQYRLQVTTGNGTTSMNALNSFSIQAASTTGGQPTIYGQSRMCSYIAVNGTSLFYLAQIAAVHAGKTLEIKLFDPGDITSTTLRIKQPGTSGYSDATFSWTATGCSGSGCTTSGTNVTSIVASTSSAQYLNNQWITITIVLPTNYSAPTPPGEPGPGWWKIEYATTGTGQDVTTWEVNIRGNPVHLVTP